jgi:hypothetical protein
MVKALVFNKFREIPKIDIPDSVVGNKFIPYSMIGGCVLLLGYSLFSHETKDEVEVDEDVDEN